MRSSKLRSKIALWIKRLFFWSGGLILIYVLILLIGLIPANTNFRQAKEGVTIYVVSNAVHADIIVPCDSTTIDWIDEFKGHQFAESIQQESHVAFGWGDRGFFLETETWDDLKISTAAKALLIPSSSCMHVTFTRPEYYSDPVAVTISNEQYGDLVDFIDSSFEKNQQQDRKQIDGYAYSTRDAFFDAVGNYHMLNTCNSWVGRGLNHAGVCVPVLSPMPKTPTLYFPEN